MICASCSERIVAFGDMGWVDRLGGTTCAPAHNEFHSVKGDPRSFGPGSRKWRHATWGGMNMAADQSYVLADDDDVVEDRLTCGGNCGETLHARERVLDVRAPEFGDRAVTTVHLRCYQGEDVV